MDLRAIKYFLTIAEEGNITAAAKRLHMAQPPLSRQMKQLEADLGGVKLFERGRKLKLTEAGLLLRNRAEHLLDLLATTIKELQELEAGTQGTLSFGTVTSSGATILPKLIRVFRNHYPGVHFQLWEGETHRITALLDQGIIDIGFVRFPFDLEKYESISLPNEPLVLAFNPTGQGNIGEHPHVVNLAELAGKPLMIHRRHETMLIEHCHQAGFEPYLLCKSDDVMPILAWSDANIGIAVVPRSAVGLIPSTNLIIKEIINPSLQTTGAIIWMRNRYLSATARHFLDLFMTLNSQNEPG